MRAKTESLFIPGPRAATNAPVHSEIVREQADAVLQSFNTWALKREHPTEPELLRSVLQSRIAAGDPIHFVLYWGKGPRSAIADPDVTCLNFLNGLRQRIAKVYAPGATVMLCQTDTHARLNGHGEREIAHYFGDVTTAARSLGMQSVMMSRLVALAGRPPMLRAPPDPDMLDALEACASKWYRGNGTPSDGAKIYHAMNLVERRAIELSFPECVFITFNGRRYRSLFPETLPVFYMYSLRRGTSVKPWFIDEKGLPFEGAEGVAGT